MGGSPSLPAEPDPGTLMTDAFGVLMIYVPAGKFRMGSTAQQVREAVQHSKKQSNDARKEWYENQMPQHEQIITAGFWLDLTPVTNANYASFVTSGAYRNPIYWTEAGWEWLQQNQKKVPRDYNGFTDPQQPRVGITWFEAVAYCAWRGGRLPTEAEWEWAARGPENHLYPWGNSFHANGVIYNRTIFDRTASVGAGIREDGASWVGALDMSGNVCEWCSTLYQPYPYHSNDGREDRYEGTQLRVLRGGTWWFSDPAFLRATYRNCNLPRNLQNDWGIRCARSA